MTLQINLLTPTPTTLLKTPETNTVIDEFEQSGSWDEIFMLGPQVPLAALKAIHYQAVNPLEDWACLQLVHLHATRDHLVLIDPSIVKITLEEEEVLRKSVQETLEHFGVDTVLPVVPNGSGGASWLFKSDLFASLKTSTVDLAKGRNIDIWMPQDTETAGIARKWRQLQNEIQMIWHDHPINTTRYERGELPINSVWLQGVGSLSQIFPHAVIKFSKELHSNSHLMANLAQFLNKPFHTIHPAAIAQLESGVHYLDGRNQLTSTAWESLWQVCLTLLDQGQVKSIQLVTEYQGHTLTSTLDKSHLQLGFFQRLLTKFRTTRQPFPTWDSIATKLPWQSEQVA